jgi:hypothetical protein
MDLLPVPFVFVNRTIFRNELICHIESIFEVLVDALVEGKDHLTLPLNSRSRRALHDESDNSYLQNNRILPAKQSISFPGISA